MRQLHSFDIVSPGGLGLNYAKSASILPPQFAVDAFNAVIDSNGRLSARKGYTVQTTTPITDTPAIKSLHEYIQQDGTTEILVAWDGGIANDIGDPEGNDISGSITDTDGTWYFQNFNDKVVGFQAGQKLIVYTGAGNFATVSESSGTAPSGGVGVAAYGRIWQLDSDGTTIKYCALLNETDWGGASAGSIDMANVWTHGTDEVRAITAFNGFLVVFGRRHIVFWTDGTGSVLGLDPANIYVSDIIEGTGCESQWSVQPVGESDLVFLSKTGVQSLGRVIQEKSNPLTTLSKYVGRQLVDNLTDQVHTDIRSVYSPLHGFYILSLPDVAVSWVFDYRRIYLDEQQDAVCPITLWGLAPSSWVSTIANNLYLGNTAGIGLYGSYTDGTDTIRFRYHSPWLDLGEELGSLLKIMKKMGFVVWANTNSTVVFKWFTDFDRDFRSISKTFTSSALSEWGTAEWGEDEWGGGLSLVVLKIPARGKGQYFRIAIESDITGEIAIQQAELFAKLGRMA